MRLLRHEDVAGILTLPEAIAAVRAGLLEEASGLAQVPPRLTADHPSGWIRLMPGLMNGSGFMGFKAMHSTQGVGVGYFIALYRQDTGRLECLMDADWITVVRTAATSAVAADLLAPARIQRVAVLGSGEQARAQLLALRAVRPFQEVRVYSPTLAHREAFAREMARRLQVPVEAVGSPEEAVEGAQVVLLAFRAGTQPVFRARWLAPGMHVCGISSVRPEAREVEDEVWSRCSRVVVDDREQVLASGDGRSGLASGHLRPERMVELKEVVAGRQPGRGSPEEITLFKSVGSALQDLALAAAVYRRAVERGIGQELGEFPRLRPAGHLLPAGMPLGL